MFLAKLHDAREGMDLSSLMYIDVHCRMLAHFAQEPHYAPPIAGGYCQQRKSMNINEHQWLTQRF
jgi:hypothetical protein